MLIDEIYVDSGITEANIASLSSENEILAEKRICEVSELAEIVTKLAVRLIGDGYDISAVLDLVISGLDFSKQPSLEFALPENRDLISAYLKGADVLDKASFSLMLTARLRKEGISVSETDFLPVEKTNESITYVKNRLADEAYDVFSQDFISPTISYSDSFKEAAHSVSTGKYGYCLLPLEERGARISAISSIIFTEDLKINSVTPVFGMDASADMKYALVSKSFFVPNVDEDDDAYLEIRISAFSSDELSDIVVAASALGISVYRVNTVNFNTEEGGAPHFTMVFKKNGADFTPFLIYLTMFSDTFNAVGMYKNLE